MPRKWRLAMLAAVIGACIAATACNNNDANNNAGQDAGGTAGETQGGNTSAAAAETIAKQNCIACHGDALDGRGNANMNLQTVGARYSRDEIAAIITNGRNNMPAFKGRLKDDEIGLLSDWLATKK